MVRNNTFFDLDIGIYVSGDYGRFEFTGNYFHHNQIGLKGNFAWRFNFTYNTLSNNSQGLFLIDCGVLNITNNSFSHSFGTSIYAEGGALIDISYNNLSQGYYGVHLNSTFWVYVHHNNFYQIVSAYNQPSMCNDTGESNMWFDYISLQGNYWSNFEW